MTTIHEFTAQINDILKHIFGDVSQDVFEKSEILQYINIKTRSASSGSKSRGSFANHYALYVLVEDYIKNGFHQKTGYSSYVGARFSDLFKRQRELPFGSKLQNHALNHRLNQEFRKFFPTCEYTPILRDTSTNRYWINENLLAINIGDTKYNISEPIINIIDAYVDTKRDAFEKFIAQCERLNSIQSTKPTEVHDFVVSLLQHNVDARIFEIVSYAILKPFYGTQSIFWGWNIADINEEQLVLYKTGRTNANDGGIDFVMRPLGRFFQVTETTDVRKYFLDIEKIQKFPVTFVVKSETDIESLSAAIRAHANRIYGVDAIVARYMTCIEELINIPVLTDRFTEVVERGNLTDVVNELIIQSRLEFNLPVE